MGEVIYEPSVSESRGKGGRNRGIIGWVREIERRRASVGVILRLGKIIEDRLLSSSSLFNGSPKTISASLASAVLALSSDSSTSSIVVVVVVAVVVVVVVVGVIVVVVIVVVVVVVVGGARWEDEMREMFVVVEWEER